MRKSFPLVLFIVFAILFNGSWMAYRVVSNIQFDRGCEGHLKRAADANTVELAKRELETALQYMESNHLTDGYTSIIYQTPDEDIGFWYGNLKGSLQELVELSPDASPLERSNMLIKLRETLLDHNASLEKVTAPDGISLYPNNALACLWATVSTIVLLIAMVVAVRELNE